MVVSGRGRCKHVVDQRAAFLREHLAEAILLRREELVEGGLGHFGSRHDLFDRRHVVAAGGEQHERRVGDALAAPFGPRVLALLGA
jgi:hypothetical protein